MVDQSSSELIAGLPTVFEGDFSLNEPLPTTLEDAKKFLDEKIATWNIGSDPMDAATVKVIEDIKSEHTPESATILTNTLFNCIQQVNNRHLTPSESVSRKPITNEYTEAVKGQLKHLFIDALETDTNTTFERIKEVFDPRQMESTFFHHTISDLLSLPETMNFSFRQTATNSCSYFGIDYAFQGLPPNTEISLQAMPGGIIVATDQQKNEVINWYSLNPFVRQRDANTPLPWEPGINQRMMMGFTEHQLPSNETLKRFFSDLPELINQLSPFFVKDSSPLQNHIAGFFHIWESQEENSKLTPETQSFFETFKEDAFHFFTAGIFSPEENQNVVSWLTNADAIAMSRKNGEETTLGKYLLNQIQDVTKFGPQYAELSTSTQESKHALLQTFFEQTRAIMMTGVDITLESISNEEGELDQSALNFTVLALSNQIELFHELLNFHLSAPIAVAQTPSETLHVLLQQKDIDWSLAGNQQILRTVTTNWFSSRMLRQRNAPYFKDINQITGIFYEKYQSITHLKDRTTVNDEIELPKHQLLLDNDYSSGRIKLHSQEEPYRVTMLGCVGMRIEKHLQQPIRDYVGSTIFSGYDPYPPSDNHETEELLNTFQAISLQNLRLHPELKNTADRTLALGSPLMDVVRFFEQVEAIASLAHITKINGILETDNAFTRGKNSYEAEINVAKNASQAGFVEGNFTRSWTLPDGEIIGKPFDGKDPLIFIQIMQEAGFEPVNFPGDTYAIKAICELASLDDSFIESENLDDYIEKLITNHPEQTQKIMKESVATKAELAKWITHAKLALYQVPTPERTYNRWLLEFQKVREPSELFAALLENVEKNFILPVEVEELAVH